MINYIDKGSWLGDVIDSSGFYIMSSDGVLGAYDDEGNQSTEIDTAVQLIIDTFDPLPEAQAEALSLVKQASVNQRLKYVTQAAGKDAEYTYKALEATQFDTDGTVGVFMQGRMTATGQSAALIAADWNLRGGAWRQIGANIAGLEDKASLLIRAETDWKQCAVIANNIISEIEQI